MVRTVVSFLRLVIILTASMTAVGISVEISSRSLRPVQAHVRCSERPTSVPCQYHKFRTALELRIC